MSPSVGMPTTICEMRFMRTSHNRMPVHTPTYEERRHENEETTKEKHEIEDPPLPPFWWAFGNVDWALFIHEQHGDSQHTATRRAHTHIAITKEAKK